MRYIRQRGLSRLPAFLVGIMLAFAGAVAPASAAGLFGQTRYAAIVVDAATGEVLYSKRPDAVRYPASITKIMTLYLTFEALSTGRLKLNDRVSVTAHAASMMPSKTNLRPGDSLTTDEAIRVVAVHSANDIAVALAEKIGGSESKFAQLMSLRAQELGMANTRFVNANGVPDPRQVTTARDIAILSRAVMRDYPQYYSYFGVRSFSLRGQLFTNHNHLLREPGYDGFKTGFTNAAGYNLSASAVRDSRRLITVVLGGSSAAGRDENVQTLMNAGFDVLRKRSLGQKTTIAANIAEPDDTGPVERPSVEQGDGGESGLSVEVNDPAHGDQLAEGEQRLDAKTVGTPPPGSIVGRHVPQVAGCATGTRHSRRHHAAACHRAAPTLASLDCSRKRGRGRHSCSRSRVTLAKATTRPRGHRGHHHRSAQA